MKKTTDRLFLSLLAAITVGIGSLIFILPKASFSQKENRPLADLPRLNIQNLADGSYFSGLSDFYRDRLPLREQLTSLYSLCELARGAAEVGGVIPSSNVLIALPNEAPKQIEESLTALRAASPNAELFIPPRATDCFSSLLPEYYSDKASEDTLDLLTPEELSDLKHIASLSDAHYRTDHHWTTEGAYNAYTLLCRRLSIEPIPREYFTIETVSTDFYGSSFSKSGLPYSSVSPDSIQLYRYQGDTEVEVYDREKNTVTHGFYSLKKLESNDKYGVFLGGNYPHISVSSGQDKPTLLLIKDSYANCVIPFLALHFNIEVIDPRYCTAAYLNEQLTRSDIDKTVILISLDTLSTQFAK